MRILAGSPFALFNNGSRTVTARLELYSSDRTLLAMGQQIYQLVFNAIELDQSTYSPITVMNSGTFSYAILEFGSLTLELDTNDLTMSNYNLTSGSDLTFTSMRIAYDSASERRRDIETWTDADGANARVVYRNETDYKLKKNGCKSDTQVLVSNMYRRRIIKCQKTDQMTDL